MSADGHRARVTADGLDLGDRVVPLLAGEVHYYQHHHGDWPRILDGLVGLGLGLVSTYVPWGVHETAPGKHDFGERRRHLDVERFVELAAERDLLVVLRPGPHVNAELNLLGFPARLFEDPTVLARTPRGNPVWIPLVPRPMAVPSYASPAFLDQAERWLRAVVDRLGHLLWPLGPIAVVQLDNEAPLLFRDGPFDQDYCEAARAAFSRYLEERNRPVEDPPTRLDATAPGDLRRYFDWLDFRVSLFADALALFRRCLEDRGATGVAFSHNLTQGGTIPPVCPSAFPAADLVGFDFYHQPHLLRQVRGRCLYAVGTTELPWAAELGTGAPWNLPPMGPEDSATLARATVAYGLRGMSFYMTADRERWYGAPLDHRGNRKGPAASRLAELVTLLRRTGFNELRLRAKVAIVVPRTLVRLSQATWALGTFAPPSVEAFGIGPELGCTDGTFGFEEPVQIVWQRALAELQAALGRHGVGYVIIDGDAAGDRLDGVDLAVALTYEMLDAELWRALLSAAERGLELFVGPRIPSMDEDGKPLSESLGLLEGSPLAHGAGSVTLVRLDDAAAADGLAATLAERSGIVSPLRPTSSDVDVTLLEREGEPVLVAVAEVAGRARRAERIEVLVPDLELEGATIVDGAMTVDLEPNAVRLYEVRGR